MHDKSQRFLAGRSAIVTGSTSGIGLGIAEALARAGANVALNGFGDAGEITKLRVRLATDHEVQVTHSSADMSKPDQIYQLADEVRSAFGAVDIVVNNAGVQHVAPIEGFANEKWDQIIAINLSSAFHLTKATIADMKDRRFGRIINVASAHALVASPFKSAYVAAKHGIAGLTKCVALEAAEYNVTCNAICPGYVLTPLVQKQIPEQAAARGVSEDEIVRNVLLAAQPTKRFVTVEEVASLAAFLCSDAAASITGAALPIEGGWTSH